MLVLRTSPYLAKFGVLTIIYFFENLLLRTSQLVVDKTTECLMYIYQNRINEETVSITFDSSVFVTANPADFLQLVSSSNPCVSPNEVVIIQGSRYCRRPCTSDEVLDDGVGICIPISCTRKYGSVKPFFNAANHLCEQLVSCPDHLTLDATVNMCTGLEALKEEQQSDGSAGGFGDNFSSIDDIWSVINITCVHGQMARGPEGYNVCVCHDGWTSRPWTYVELMLSKSYEACSITASTNSASTASKTQTAEDTDYIWITVLIVLFVLLLCVIAFFILEKCCCFCLRDNKKAERRRQKRNRSFKKGVLQQDLSSDDEQVNTSSNPVRKQSLTMAASESLSTNANHDALGEVLEEPDDDVLAEVIEKSVRSAGVAIRRASRRLSASLGVTHDKSFVAENVSASVHPPSNMNSGRRASRRFSEEI
jgi:hypothetical protein